MSCTDYLKISEHKIFKETCEVLPKNVNKPLNLATVRDCVLFTWDFSNNCVLSLNIKAVRGKESDNVIHQKILPLHPPLFSPEFLLANERGSLLIVGGSNGVLVLQLPRRCPPYGAYDNNKELVYCRSYSLDERLLACSDVVQVRQAKFHPGSPNDSHILVLTSDNKLRLYQIENNEAECIGVYPVGEEPRSMFPGSKTTFLDIYGEIAVDFDFGFPEIIEDKPLHEGVENLEMTIKNEDKSLLQLKNLDSRPITKITPNKPNSLKKSMLEELLWPIYILRSDFSVYSLRIDLSKRSKPVLKGPCLVSQQPDFIENDACSIICLKTTPQIMCIASATGTLVHSILLDIDAKQKEKLKRESVSLSSIPDKELLVFETVELELGITISPENDDEDSNKYKCPIFLQKDESKVSRYFATHGAGVHTIHLNCVEGLHEFVFGPEDEDPTSDIFINPSDAEYLVCTKKANTTSSNPVIGCSIYYEPTSIICLLGDGSVVTLGILSAAIAPKNDKFILLEGESQGSVQSPLKKMLNEPFEEYIQKILKKGSSRPLLKLSSTSNNTPEECYDLLQRASQMFREEHFKNYTKAREELEKRAHTLNMLKQAQKQEIDKMVSSKDELRNKAENLAEKYEDIKDKQDELLKRCEQLVILVARKRAEPSDAEKKFMDNMKEYSLKCVAYREAIDKVKQKSKYQQIQIENWKSLERKRIDSINEVHKIQSSDIIKNTLQDFSQKINHMVKQVNEYKKLLNLK